MKAIMYHYVREDQKDLPHFKYLHIDDFRQQLDYFEKEFGFVSKEDFIDSLKTGVPVSGSILTFDDGLFDHHQYVLPELLKRNLWGLFYICSGPYLNKKLIGPHRVHLLLGAHDSREVLKATQEIVTPEMLTFELKEEFRNDTYIYQNNDEASLRVKRILNYYVDEKYRQAVLDALMKTFFGNKEVSLTDGFYLSPSQIMEMSDYGMIIGNHTVNHPVMSKLSYKDQEKEIYPVFEYIDTTTDDVSIRTYCHPYGGFHSFNKDTLNILKKAKCLFSFNTEDRDISQRDLKSKKQFLPRYDCNVFPHGSTRKNTKMYSD